MYRSLSTCPCCEQPVAVPTLECVIQAREIRGFPERILEAVWKGKGRFVPRSRLIDALYCDDYDGGPSEGRAGAAVKEAAHRLRAKLDGSGVGIENNGAHTGYRLILRPSEAPPIEPRAAA